MSHPVGNLTGQGTQRPLANSHIGEGQADSPGHPSLWWMPGPVYTTTVTSWEALSQNHTPQLLSDP